MQHKAISSTNIKSIGYDQETRKLQVRFKSGGTYEYDGVTPEMHARFLNAPSPGGHFRDHILPNFKGKKI
jgi:hypothetical protein